MAANVVLGQDQQNALNVLIAYHKAIKSPFDNLSDKKKAFIEASKAFSMIAGAGLTGLNMFGVTIAYMSKNALHANTSLGASSASAATAPSSNVSRRVNTTEEWMVVATFLCFLYTCCTAAIAHGTVHRVIWFKNLRIMVYLEILLLSVIGGFSTYMLTVDADGFLVGVCSTFAFILMAVLTHLSFYEP